MDIESNPTGKIAKKDNVAECNFCVHVALHIECRFNEILLFQNDFFAFFANWEEIYWCLN